MKNNEMKMFMMNINVYDELKMFMMNGKCNDEPKTFMTNRNRLYDEPKTFMANQTWMTCPLYEQSMMRRQMTNDEIMHLQFK